MTRTERAAYPRALNRDRSESRNGLDASLRKGGAGSHNWGSIADEQRLEDDALGDEPVEPSAELVEGTRVLAVGLEPSNTSPKPPMERKSSDSSATSNQPTDEEREKARQLRKNAFKKSDQLDLSAIARTSAAVSGSPPRTVNLTSRTEIAAE